MWKNNPDPWELRQMFPEEARLLEDTLLNEELNSLQIAFGKSKLKRSTTFKISLADNYELWISPVDIGPGGQAEWFTWHRVQHSPDAQSSSDMPNYHMSIRAYIQLVSKSSGKNVIVHSFTNAQGCLEDLIRSSLNVIHRDLGLQLNPIRKSMQQRSSRGRNIV